MEWTNDNILEFISHYETEPILWNPSEPGYKRKDPTYEAWQRVRNKISWLCTVDDLKKKRDSLMAYYRQHLRIMKKKISETGEKGQLYNVNWFAFGALNSFLQQVYVGKVTSSSQISEEDDDQSSDVEILNTDKQTDQQSADQETVSRQYVNQDNAQSFRKKRRIVHDLNEGFNNEDDECDIFGKLIAIKIRRLKNYYAKQVLMNDIHNMVTRACLQDNTHETIEFNIPQPSNQIDNNQNYQILISPESLETKPMVLDLSDDPLSELASSKNIITDSQNKKPRKAT